MNLCVGDLGWGYMIALLLIVADFVLLLGLLSGGNSTGAQFMIQHQVAAWLSARVDRTARATHLSYSRMSTHITLYTCSYHTAHLLVSYTHLLTSSTHLVIHTPAHTHTCSHHAAPVLLLFNRLSGAYSHVSRRVPTAARRKVPKCGALSILCLHHIC